MLTPEIREQIQKSLALYGAELNADDVICKGDRNTQVKVELKGRRIQYRTTLTGSLRFSSSIDSKDSASYFVETYWYWSKIKC